MIQILPINNGLFERELTKKELKSIEVNKLCYISDIKLISSLLTIDTPIKNRRIFISNVLSFLRYLDHLVDLYDTQLPITQEVFVEYFGRDNYRVYQNILSELRILTNVTHKDGTWYKRPTGGNAGVCKTFRIHNEYLKEKELCVVIIDEPKRKSDRILSIDDRLDLDKRYIKTIDKIEVNTKNAIDAELKHCVDNDLSSNVLRSRISRIFYTRQRRFIKKGKKVDRVFHSFTNLSKVSRKHLSKNFNSLDIVNCQPLLLASYLITNELSIDTKYQEDCEIGNFYEEFYSLDDTKDEEEKRKCVKQSIYKNLFFGFNERSLYNKRFKMLYPLTWESLKDISNTKESLASRLQNLEAVLFNNLSPKKSEYFFTLFDAIYFTDTQDISKLKKDITKFFTELGVKVTTELN